MARRNIAIQASVFRPRLSQRSAKVKYILNPLGRYALEKKAGGEEEVRSEVIAGFKAPANAFLDDRANLLALRKLLR